MIRQPGEIERTSFALIRDELRERNIRLDPENEAVILRCIHASADFDYAGTLLFTPDAAEQGVEALRGGCDIVTDTNMARAGISRTALQQLGGETHCLMAEERIAEAAKARKITRAAAAMAEAAKRFPSAVYAVGNAPTALFPLAEEIRRGLRPALIVAVPVAFVNVVESKEHIVSVCRAYGIPAIAAMGRKGGSSIAAAVCNALLYTAANMQDPAGRGWN